jgi:hypothetical protein
MIVFLKFNKPTKVDIYALVFTTIKRFRLTTKTFFYEDIYITKNYANTIFCA